MSSIVCPSCVAPTFTSTSSRPNLNLVIPLRPQPAKGNFKRFRCCPLSGRYSSQDLAHLHGTVKTQRYGRLASKASVHFLEFVGHWLLVSLLAPSSTRAAGQTPGCDSLGYVARDWREKEIHFSPEAPFPVPQCVLQPDARGRCWRGASSDADQECASPPARAPLPVGARPLCGG